jgi:hypothetical protein
MEVYWTNPALGTPDHALRPVLENPSVYNFDRPISGTYPPWKDPSWWLSGAQAHLRLADVWARFKTESRALARIALLNPLYPSLLFLCLASAGVHLFRGKIQLPTLRGAAFRILWFLTLYSVAGLTAYVILVVSPQYVAVFLMILAVAWLSWLTLILPFVLPRWLPIVVPIATLIFAISFLPGLARASWLCLPPAVVGTNANNLFDLGQREIYSVEVAHELQRNGVKPGSRVALLGSLAAEYWGLLCRVHFVADVPQNQMHLLEEREQFRRALDAFRRAGAEFVVVTVNQVPAMGSDGIEIANGSLRLIDLRKSASLARK